MPIIDVDHVGGLPEGSLIALSNHELAQQLRDAVKAEEAVGGRSIGPHRRGGAAAD
ncbi:hypothetical protein [Aeromonas veronii]|uniref:hypothetical protein n=1 Tax=Aeromonas veronii TaxID=654 RepID=UPI0024867563|nr:hypothetical protein [Aeromonas veronii]